MNNSVTNESEMAPHLRKVAELDVAGLLKAQEAYGDSWKKRGGVGAFMMLARKWDRLEQLVTKERGEATQYDVFTHVVEDLLDGGEGVYDAILDLRRYLMLVEAELRRQGIPLPTQRDNVEANPPAVDEEKPAFTRLRWPTVVPAQEIVAVRRCVPRHDLENPFGYQPDEEQVVASHVCHCRLCTSSRDAVARRTAEAN